MTRTSLLIRPGRGRAASPLYEDGRSLELELLSYYDSWITDSTALSNTSERDKV